MRSIHELAKSIFVKSPNAIEDKASGFTGVNISHGPAFQQTRKIEYKYGLNGQVTGLLLTETTKTSGFQFSGFTTGDNPNARNVQQIIFKSGQVDITLE